jgi:hypothetical protein
MKVFTLTIAMFFRLNKKVYLLKKQCNIYLTPGWAKQTLIIQVGYVAARGVTSGLQ